MSAADWMMLALLVVSHLIAFALGAYYTDRFDAFVVRAERKKREIEFQAAEDRIWMARGRLRDAISNNHRELALKLEHSLAKLAGWRTRDEQ